MNIIVALIVVAIVFVILVALKLGDILKQQKHEQQIRDYKIESKIKELNVERSYEGALTLARNGDWNNAYFVYQEHTAKSRKEIGDHPSLREIDFSVFREKMENELRKEKKKDLQRAHTDKLIKNGATSDNDIVRLVCEGSIGVANSLYQRTHNCETSVDASEGIYQLMMQRSWDLILRGITEKHINVLKRKSKTQIIVDDYGNSDASKWVNEIQYFIKYVLFKDNNFSLRQEYINELTKNIYDYVSDRSFENTIRFDEHMSPIDYEHYCSDILTNAGWVVNHTPASGDQGVDLIAIKQHLKVAIQCKLYSAPVGNKAVQEVTAGMQHIGADFGVVVSNSTYTKSAKELARSTSVRLLHHDDLTSLRTQASLD